MRFHCSTLTLLVVFATEVVQAESQPDLVLFHGQVQPFLKKYCIECHGPSEQKGGVRFDQIGPITEDFAFGDLWREVQDHVLLEEMPPADEAQPGAPERLSFLDWVNKEIQRAETAFASIGGIAVLRRLNKSEYANTVRDLLQLNPLINPALTIPDDDSFHGFDNIGMALNISPVQMRSYLESAGRMIEVAFAPQPTQQIEHFYHEPASLADWHQKGIKLLGTVGQIQRNKTLTPAERKVQEAAARKAQADHGRLHDRNQIVSFGVSGDLKFPTDGVTYFNRASISAIGRPPGIYRLRVQARGEPTQQGELPLLNVVSLGDAEDITLLVTDVSATMQTYETEFLLRPGTKSIALNCEAMGNRFHYKRGKGMPGITLHSMELEGPMPDPFKTAAEQMWFAGVPESDAGAHAILSKFAERAFRRPPEPNRVEQFLAYYQTRRQDGMAFRPAIFAAMQGIMSSPEFLFMIEKKNGVDDQKQPLDAFDLATRLSYFLTSSPPDELLYADAKAGKLNSPKALLAHARRLIQSPDAQLFAENFTGQWLRLRTLGDMAPDDRKYTEWEPTLQDSMRKETESFFLYILQQGLPLTNFLRTDFTMLNSRLAHFYGIPGVEGYEFRRVSLKADEVRGGLLTHASILTLTSDGIRTSPVKRGTFLLENIFGDPPPPPPNNVPPVKETKGATLRERLASHREEPACANCHAKIDPLGFALENFNAIGKWRVKEEDSGLPVDPSGKMPAGGTFNTFVEFRDLLAQRGDDVAHCLTEKLLMYALGRPVEFNDRPAVRMILEKTKADQYKLNTLVEAIVVSEPFLTK